MRDPAERMKLMEELLKSLILDKDFQPVPCRDCSKKAPAPPAHDCQICHGSGVEKTFCNFAVNRFLHLYASYKKMDGMMANAMIDFMLGSSDFRVVPTAEAAARAFGGDVVIAGMKMERHGHVAVVAPRQTQFSQSLQRQVAVVANVGMLNDFMKVSKCFPVRLGEPLYFLLVAKEAA